MSDTEIITKLSFGHDETFNISFEGIPIENADEFARNLTSLFDDALEQFIEQIIQQSEAGLG